MRARIVYLFISWVSCSFTLIVWSVRYDDATVKSFNLEVKNHPPTRTHSLVLQCVTQTARTHRHTEQAHMYNSFPLRKSGQIMEWMMQLFALARPCPNISHARHTHGVATWHGARLSASAPAITISFVFNIWLTHSFRWHWALNNNMLARWLSPEENSYFYNGWRCGSSSSQQGSKPNDQPTEWPANQHETIAETK